MSKSFSRLTGLLYLLLLPTIGAPYLFSVHLQAGGPGELVSRIQMNQPVFELAVVGAAAGFVVFLLLGLAFYRLLSPAGRNAAALLLAFVAASIPISLVAIGHWVDILSLLEAVDGAPVQDGGALQTQVVASMRSYDNLMLVAAIFWGLWLAPLGWLIYRSRIAPRILGLLLMIGSLHYVLFFAGSIITPEFETTVVGMVSGLVFGVPSILGELGTALWLLVVGARSPGASRSGVGA